MSRVLLISPVDEPFVDADAAILSTRFQVDRRTGHGPGMMTAILPAAASADLVFSWFLSVYGMSAMLTAKLLGKRAVAVVGGVDAAAESAYGYGLWLDPLKAALARKAVAAADRILAVDSSIKSDLMQHSGSDGSNILVLPTGYDPDYWTPASNARDLVLTVASAADRPRAMVKGLDRLFRVASQLPDLRFRLVGTDPASIAAAGFTEPAAVPRNLEIVGRVPREELLRHYREARVYLQTSRREGLPNALCEAMLCGCIPVASAVGGTPDAVGDAGTLVREEDGFVPALRSAMTGLAGPADSAQRARQRIVGRYPLAARASALVEIVGGLLERERP